MWLIRTIDNAQFSALARTIDRGPFDLAPTEPLITPSAVSQRIEALETSAGRVLVRRTKPTVSMDAGLPYLRLARQIDALVRDVVSVSRLGSIRHRPMAHPRFAARWFAAGLTSYALSRAPMVVFDARDDLQDRFLRGRSHRPFTPPRPSFLGFAGFADFAKAVRLGLGWGMVPNQQILAGEAEGVLVDLAPGLHLDVVLNWHQWTLHAPVLAAISEAIRFAAS